MLPMKSFHVIPACQCNTNVVVFIKSAYETSGKWLLGNPLFDSASHLWNVSSHCDLFV